MTKKVIWMQSNFHLLKNCPTLLQLIKLGNKYLLHSQVIGKFSTKLRSSFGVTYSKICDVGIKRRALKEKQYCLFWSSEKRNKGFSRISDGVESSLHKWIISHPHVIKYPIANDYIKVRFDDGNGGVNIDLQQ